jgi:heme/copper-type cytochrome/quinol oxidase subunit 3
LQILEYKNAFFCISDGIYCSCFFIFVGIIALFVAFVRVISNHFGLEAVIWYWYFVDVVWLNIQKNYDFVIKPKNKTTFTN